jgi:hypothetical protein
MGLPYPGFPPSYKVVDETGGYKRTCLVIEFLSIGALDKVQMALIQERLEACVAGIHRSLVSTVEKAQVVTPDRFDPIVCEGLRLSKG